MYSLGRPWEARAASLEALAATAKREAQQKCRDAGQHMVEQLEKAQAAQREQTGRLTTAISQLEEREATLVQELAEERATSLQQTERLARLCGALQAAGIAVPAAEGSGGIASL